MSVHLSMSYLGAAMCIISTAQHASPKVRGHREPWSWFKCSDSATISFPYLSAPINQVVDPGQSPLDLVLLEVNLEGRVSVALCPGGDGGLLSLVHITGVSQPQLGEGGQEAGLTLD